MNNKENLISIRIIGLILLLSIFLQIILGAWVRLTGSGMSCPDWPLCYGYIFPTPNKIVNIPNIEYSYFQIFLEWIHRANAALVIVASPFIKPPIAIAIGLVNAAVDVPMIARTDVLGPDKTL